MKKIISFPKGRPSDAQGFTIIELLVVIAIISILTGIIITSLTGSKAKARDAKRISDISNIQLALSLYYDRCKQYPFVLTFTENTGCPTGISWGTFMPVTPTSPNPGSYDYAVLKQNASPNLITDYILHTKLESYSEAVKDGYATVPAAVFGSTWYPPANSSLSPANQALQTLVCSNSTNVIDYCVGPK